MSTHHQCFNSNPWLPTRILVQTLSWFCLFLTLTSITSIYFCETCHRNKKTSHCPAQAFAIIFFLELSALQLHGKDHPSLWRKCPDSGCWYIHQYRAPQKPIMGAFGFTCDCFLCKHDDFNMNNTADTVLYCCHISTKHQKHGWSFHFSWYQPIVSTLEQRIGEAPGRSQISCWGATYDSPAKVLQECTEHLRCLAGSQQLRLFIQVIGMLSSYQFLAQKMQIWVKWSIHNRQTTINIHKHIFQDLSSTWYLGNVPWNLCVDFPESLIKGHRIGWCLHLGNAGAFRLAKVEWREPHDLESWWRKNPTIRDLRDLFSDFGEFDIRCWFNLISQFHGV